MNTASIRDYNHKASKTWSAAGHQYDNISHFISAAIDHCVIRVAPKPGEQIMDLATGTGWAARLLAARQAKVTGVDIAADLLEAAKKIAAQTPLDISFELGDADALPYADSSFDAIVSTFGVMFSSKPEAAAAEMARVCKKGGRIGLTTWHPEGNVFGIFKTMKPYQPAAPVPAPPSPFAWGTRERVKELLGSDFDLKFETATVYLRVPDGLAAWNLFHESYGPTKVLAASLPQERFEALKKDFIDFHDQFKTELGITMPCDYLLTVGTRK